VSQAFRAQQLQLQRVCSEVLTRSFMERLCGAMAAVMASAVSVSSRALAGMLSENLAPIRRTWYHSESLWRLRLAVAAVSLSSACHESSESAGGCRLLNAKEHRRTHAPAKKKLTSPVLRPCNSSSEAS
jgi:hypothetical protein